jgi:hypothetical protein
LDEEDMPAFASCVEELHLSITLETRSIFGSPSRSSVGEDFCDSQCLREPILGLDSAMGAPLEIASGPVLREELARRLPRDPVFDRPHPTAVVYIYIWLIYLSPYI